MTSKFHLGNRLRHNLYNKDPESRYEWPILHVVGVRFATAEDLRNSFVKTRYPRLQLGEEVVEVSEYPAYIYCKDFCTDNAPQIHPANMKSLEIAPDYPMPDLEPQKFDLGDKVLVDIFERGPDQKKDWCNAVVVGSFYATILHLRTKFAPAALKAGQEIVVCDYDEGSARPKVMVPAEDSCIILVKRPTWS